MNQNQQDISELMKNPVCAGIFNYVPDFAIALKAAAEMPDAKPDTIVKITLETGIVCTTLKLLSEAKVKSKIDFVSGKFANAPENSDTVSEIRKTIAEKPIVNLDIELVFPTVKFDELPGKENFPKNLSHYIRCNRTNKSKLRLIASYPFCANNEIYGVESSIQRKLTTPVKQIQLISNGKETLNVGMQALYFSLDAMQEINLGNLNRKIYAVKEEIARESFYEKSCLENLVCRTAVFPTLKQL